MTQRKPKSPGGGMAIAFVLILMTLTLTAAKKPPTSPPPPTNQAKTIILKRTGDTTDPWGNTAPYIYHPGTTPDAGISDAAMADDVNYLRGQTNGLNVNWTETLQPLQANAVFETVIGGDGSWFTQQASGVTFFNSAVTGNPSLKNFVFNKWTGNGHFMADAVLHELLIGLNQPEMIVNGTYVPGYYAGDFFSNLPGHDAPIFRPSDITALEAYFGGTFNPLSVELPEATTSLAGGMLLLAMISWRRHG